MNKEVQFFLDLARSGKVCDLDTLMDHLGPDSDFTILKTVDYALSNVSSDTAVERLVHYLHRGNRMQRNYCVNYFRRKEMRAPILQAWQEGRIDHIQAFAR